MSGKKLAQIRAIDKPINDPSGSEADLSQRHASSFADRLGRVVRQLGTQQAASTAAGISLSQLKRYISAQSEPPFSVISALAKAARCDLNWLAYGTPTEHRWGWGEKAGELMDYGPADDTALPDNWASIPVFDAGFSAGPGLQGVSVPDRYHFAVEERWLNKVLRRNSRHLAGVHVVGDSMLPTLTDGDVVLVDLSAQNEPLRDAIYVLRIDDCLYVKRLTMRTDGSILVSSDNKHYPTEVIDPRVTDLRVYGRVVAAFHQM